MLDGVSPDQLRTVLAVADELTDQGRALLANARSVAGDVDLLKARAKNLAGGLEPELSVAVDVMFPDAATLSTWWLSSGPTALRGRPAAGSSTASSKHRRRPSNVNCLDRSRFPLPPRLRVAGRRSGYPSTWRIFPSREWRGFAGRAVLRLVGARPNWPDRSEVPSVRSRSILLKTAPANSFRSAARDVEPIPTDRRL